MQKATFAAGCFWGVEFKFSRMPGVISTEVGYTGGQTEHPVYKQVRTGRTGHAESVNIEYDPDTVTYEELVRFFFSMHNPTTANRQGLDVGTQYRSAIFYHSDEQKEIAERVKAELSPREYNGQIVTEIVPAGVFWRAEDYHQKYIDKKERSKQFRALSGHCASEPRRVR